MILWNAEGFQISMRAFGDEMSARGGPVLIERLQQPGKIRSQK